MIVIALDTSLVNGLNVDLRDLKVEERDERSTMSVKIVPKLS